MQVARRLRVMASLKCPTKSPRRLSRTGGCAAFSTPTPHRLVGFMPPIPAAGTFRLGVKAFIELAAARLAAIGTGEEDKV
jgi:hypothetical protein